MDLVEHAVQAGSRHPWELARLELVGRLIDSLALEAARLLDVGCGDGFVLRSLASRSEFAEVVGVDTELSAELRRQLSTPEAPLQKELEPEQRDFDLLLLLDVIEHVAQPVDFMRQLRAERLRPGAAALVTVPAFQALFTEHDRRLRHHRRYSRQQLVRQLEAAGFEVQDSGYFFGSLLPVRIAELTQEYVLGASLPAEGAHGLGAWTAGPRATRWLTRALSWDTRLCLLAQRYGVRLPGLSAWALCRNPRSNTLLGCRAARSPPQARADWP